MRSDEQQDRLRRATNLLQRATESLMVYSISELLGDDPTGDLISALDAATTAGDLMEEMLLAHGRSDEVADA